MGWKCLVQFLALEELVQLYFHYYGSSNEGHIFLKMTNHSNENKVVQVLQGQGIAQGIFIPFGITYDDDCNEIRNGGLGSTTK